MNEPPKFVIVCLGIANGAPCSDVGRWLKFFDPEFRPPSAPDWRSGFVEWTNYIDDALRFDSSAEALRFWQTQSKTVPYRPDGKPNRPLTAYTVNIVKVLR